MVGRRKRHGAKFKAKVALEALKGMKTVNELGAEYGVHPAQISQWKRQLLSGVKDIFSTRQTKEEQDHEGVQASLYQEIGRLKMELDWLKKSMVQKGPSLGNKTKGAYPHERRRG